MKLHDYQEEAVEFLIKRTVVQSEFGAAIFADPGMGKTLIALEFIRRWESRKGRKAKVLIVAPLRPLLMTWPEENEKWGFNFPIKNLRKPSKEKDRNHGLYLINPESLSKAKSTKYDIIIVDESTKFKNWSAQRTKTLRKIVQDYHKPAVVLLTGTPSPNGAQDLFSQFYFCDRGQALGDQLQSFRNNFMRRIQVTNNAFTWEFRKSRLPELQLRTKKLAYRLDAKEHLDMPEIVYNNIWVDLPAGAKKIYEDAENGLFMEIEGTDSIAALGNAASSFAKCRQIANGSVYDSTGEVVIVHKEKKQALHDLHEELAGKQLLVAYQFKHDKRGTLERCIDGEVRQEEAEANSKLWNQGKLSLMGINSAGSHGLNLQLSGCSDIAWYGLTPNLEHYAQTNYRIYRQGNNSRCIRIHRILARNTIDVPLMRLIESKKSEAEEILHTFKHYRMEKQLQEALSEQDQQ